jgi:hypothetical protein
VKASALRHGQHMQSLREFYSSVVQEPIPLRFWELLEELPSFSDGSSGAGVGTEVGPTSLGSDISALTAETASLSVHRSLDGEPVTSPSLAHRQGHAAPSPAKLSTRPASDGSDV